MDINKILELIKDIPQDKWQDEKTIRKVIIAATKDSGKEYTVEEREEFVKKFKLFASDSAMMSLLPMLLKTGISKRQLNSIIKKIK